MIVLSGIVAGVDRLEFVPVGVRRTSGSASDPATYVYRYSPDAKGLFTAIFFSSAEVAGAWENGWCWRCTEFSRDRSTFSFAFKADTGNYRYADIRPTGGGLR